MSIAGLALSVFIAALFLLWLATPFFDSATATPTATSGIERQRERLLVYYQRVLRNLHDIDEDFATGKLSEEEYRPEREQWVQRGIQALKALDELDVEHLVAPEEADDASIDEAIDRTIEDVISHTTQADKIL
jgi:hypothetical protein